jgi:hypothetical protein
MDSNTYSTRCLQHVFNTATPRKEEDRNTKDSIKRRKVNKREKLNKKKEIGEKEKEKKGATN